MNTIDKIFEVLRSIRLEKREKDAQKRLLLGYMKEHPVSNGEEWRHHFQRSLGAFLTKPIIQLQPMPVLVALILMITIGAGVTVAAEGTVPGDTLYPMKIAFNEEIRGVLAFSEESRAEWAVEKTERRLEEIEKLSAEGRLDADVAAQAEVRLQAQIEEAEERAQKFEERKQEHIAAQMHSDLEGRLEAHKEVLLKIRTQVPATDEEVDQILTQVEENLTQAKERRLQAEAEVAAKTEAEVKSAAEGKKRSAENKIEEIEQFIERKGDRVGADAKAKALAELKDAKELFAQGEAKLQAGEYGKAFASFQQSMRVVQAAKLTLSAGFELNIILDDSADDGDNRDSQSEEKKEEQKGIDEQNESDKQDGKDADGQDNEDKDTGVDVGAETKIEIEL